MTIVDYYFIGINALGFMLFALNTWLYNHTADKEIDIVMTIITPLGGALGVALGMLFFARKAHKQTMLSRVYTGVLLVIEIAIFLIYKFKVQISFFPDIGGFFKTRPWLWIYLIIINVITFITYGVDKRKAINRSYRISIVTLLLLAFVGGSIGALCGMYLFHHKTKKIYFTLGVPMILIMHIIVIFLWANTVQI